jgi:hypothetical protein
MSEVQNIAPPVAVTPPGKSPSSIGNRLVSTDVATNGESPSAVLKSQTDLKPRTPSEALIRKSDGSTAVEVTISLGAGRTNTYEKSVRAAESSQK